VALRDVDDDLAVAVEPARRVALELAGGPSVAGPGLPGEGGQVGSTPTPSIVQWRSRRTAVEGTASETPTSNVSPGLGGASKAAKSRPLVASVVRSTFRLPSTEVSTWATVTGTIGRSSRVVKTTASSVSVRIVATWVPPAIRTASACGAESQKVTSPRAAEGEKGGRRSAPGTSVVAIGNAVEAVEELVRHPGEGLDEVTPGSETLWSVHSDNAAGRAALASSTRSWKRRSSRLGTGRAIGHSSAGIM